MYTSKKEIEDGGVFFPRLSFYYKSNMSKFEDLVAEGLKIVIYIALPAFFGTFLVGEDHTRGFDGQVRGSGA